MLELSAGNVIDNVLLGAGSAFATTALGTIRESSCSWESAKRTQPATSEAAPEADWDMITKDEPHVTAHMPQLPYVGPSQHDSRLPEKEMSLQSPSDTHSELAESVELELDLERRNSSSASSVRSVCVPDAEISTEPTLAAHSTGQKVHTPGNVHGQHTTIHTCSMT